MRNPIFEEGNLLFFRPFLFKKELSHRTLVFPCAEKMEGDILLAVCLLPKTMYQRIWNWSTDTWLSRSGCLMSLFSRWLKCGGQGEWISFAFKKSTLWCKLGYLSGWAVWFAGTYGTDFHWENRRIERKYFQWTCRLFVEKQNGKE